MGRVRSGLATVTAVAMLLWFGLPAASASLYAATYAVPAVPTPLVTAQTAPVQVTVTNTGTATWTAGGTNPVHLSYHWYDATGATLVFWDGARTALAADVGPGASATVSASVNAPATPGVYVLRFALVKEGVTWFDPEPATHSVTVLAAFSATFGAVTVPALLNGATTTVPVAVTNSGGSTWLAAGANPVNLSYHWYDTAGAVVKWDGERTTIGTDLAPGASRTLNATVLAPSAPGTYAIAFDMVREGVSWFGQQLRLGATVNPAIYRATYIVGVAAAAFIGDTRSVPVTLTNTGNVTWHATGANLVDLSYHWYDASGALVKWDGQRTTLAADVAPGASTNVSLATLIPASPGTYVLRIDLVQEGVAWFSSLGNAPASVTFSVTTGLNAGYGLSTTPSSITVGAPFPTSVLLYNTGQRTWNAGGTNPVHLSYHIVDSGGAMVLWDGGRGLLSKDVAAGQQLTVDIVVTAPSYSGTFSVVWDLVQEGVTWFSAIGIPTKRDPLSVFPGVTFYGKGWGHGIGMSQWGAQGWAEGAGGPPLTGEQIVAKYYPGTTLGPVTDPMPIRVQLSWPSTGCNARTVVNFAQMSSAGGVKLVKNANPSVVIITAAPAQTIRVWVTGGVLYVMDEWSAQVIYSGSEDLALVPLDATKPIAIDQKARQYRGTLLYQIAGSENLRVVNYVNPDDYTKGAVPTEMPSNWQLEAYKAQALAARTYAAWKQATMKALPWDLRDDTADQCYGGATVETAPTNQAVALTSLKIITYNGGPIRAYYSSSDGGSTESNGCVWNLVKTATGSYTCGSAEPYLTAVPDPADLAAYDSRGPNPQRTWVRSFTATDIENALSAMGLYIGSYVSIDLSNTAPGGHVMSVKVRGTAATVEVKADDFLRTRLGVKSTMVRTSPF